MKKINPRWLPAEIKKKEAKAQETYEQMIKNCVNGFDRLSEIINEDLAGLESPKSTDEYDCPSWSHKQADRLGQIRAYRNILRLLKLPKE